MYIIINYLNKIKCSNLKLESHKDELILVRRTGLQSPDCIVAVIAPLNKKVFNIYYDFQKLPTEIDCKFVSNVKYERVNEFIEALFGHLAHSEKAVSLESWLKCERLKIKSIPSQLTELYTSALHEEMFQ